MNQLDVLCIGIACVDTIVKGFDIYNFTNKYEETHRVEEIIKSIGGDAANQAINLEKLSNKVGIICGVGDDFNGNFIKDILKKQGILIDSLLTYKNYYSSQAIVLVDNNGQRRFISPKTNQLLPYNIHSDMILPAKVVSLGSIGSLPFRKVDNILNTINAAKKNGSIVCADVICSGWLKDIDQIEDALSQIDYIFPNLEEASILTKKNNISEMADIFLEKGVKNVVIKLGKQGCFYKNKKEAFIVPAVKNINVIDTTGAGDSFAAGYINGLIKNKNNIECCKYANAIAAINVQYTGTTEVEYQEEQINKYLNNIEREEYNESIKCK